MEMAAKLILHCDRFQLPIFSILCLYGLRPGEIGWLFGEDMTDGWLRVIVTCPQILYHLL
jgi:hypothetical protein